MGYIVDTTGQTVGEGNNGFAPLAAGNYQVTIYDAEFKDFGPNSANAGRPGVNYQFRISDGQTGANRRVFQQIGLFPRWAPSAKSPDGADNFLFFGFFAALLGKSEKDFRVEVREAVESAAKAGNSAKTELPIPDPVAVLGKPLTLVLGIENDTYAFGKYTKAVAEGTEQAGLTQDDFKRNTVKGFKPAGTVAAASASKSAADDGLITL